MENVLKKYEDEQSFFKKYKEKTKFVLSSA